MLLQGKLRRGTDCTDLCLRYGASTRKRGRVTDCVHAVRYYSYGWSEQRGVYFLRGGW